MSLEFLKDYLVLVVVGICLCVGYIIKHFTSADNKYIPLVLGVLGAALNVWVNMSLTPDILLGGLFSGLSATGLHEMFKQLINDK